MAPLQLIFGRPQGGDDPGKPSPEVGQDLSDVVSAGAEYGEEGIPDGAPQRASRQAAVGFHVTDFGLDGAAAAKVGDQLWRQAAPGAADQDACPVLAMAAIAAVDDGQIRALVGQDFHLFQCRAEGMAVVGIARKAAHADDEALVQRGCHADLAAEFIADPRLAFGDAVDLGLMQGVDLVGPLGLLVQQLRDQGELRDDPAAQIILGDVLQVAAQIAHDTAGIALQSFQCLAHALELLGMGVAAHLQRQPRPQAGIGLPQLHASLLRQGDQLFPRPLVKSGVRRIGDVLFHDGGVDRHAPGAVLVDGAGFLPRPDGLGQQPFDTFLADTPPPAGQRRGVDRRTMLEERLPGEMLIIRVLDPTSDHRLVRQPVGVLQIQQPGNQPRVRRRPTLARWKEPGPLPLEHLPVNQRGKLHQLVARVDHVGQTRTQQVILFLRARTVLHGQNRNCSVSATSIQNPAVIG